MFIPLMIFLIQILVSRSLLILLKYALLFFAFFPFLLVWWHLLPIFLSTSLREFKSFPGLVVLFLPQLVFFHSSLWAWHIFQCQMTFLYPGCIFLLFVIGFSVLFIIISSYHYFTPCRFFTPTLAGGLLQESERQQVFSGTQLKTQTVHEAGAT